MAELKEAVVVDMVRTPFCRSGKDKGYFRDFRSDDMGVEVLKAIVERNGIDPADVEDVILGAVEQLGEQAHPGRNCLVLAGFPYEVAGLSIERACVTAMAAVHTAATAIMSGMGDIFIAGGLDSMTHLSLPVVTPDTDFDALLKEPGTMLSAMNPNPRMYSKLDPLELVGGITAEKLAKDYDIPREDMDRWGVMSNQRAIAAQKAGIFKREIVPCEGLAPDGSTVTVENDVGPRENSTYEKIASLSTPFMPGEGRINAATSSGTADGAAACLLMSKDKAEKMGKKPLATIRTLSVAGCDPRIMGYSVVPSTRKALERANLTIDQMDIIEINEAFAVVPLVLMKEFGLTSADNINVNGGACAMGHPVGATGARLVGHLAYELERRNLRWGLATICGGYGQGGATILEREDY